MALSVPSQSKIPTRNPQLGVAGAVRPASVKGRPRRRAACGSARVSGETREAPAETIVWWWRWRGCDGVSGAGGQGPVAGSVVRERPATPVPVGVRGGSGREAGKVSERLRRTRWGWNARRRT
jgi:hypothetical protein